MILIRTHEHDHTHAHRVQEFPCTLGRSMRCTIHLEDPSVSARHAEIVEDASGLTLRDLGSTNGIVQAGIKVKEVKLLRNETVYLGDVRIELLVDEILSATRQNRLWPAEELGRTPPWKIVLSLAFGYAGVTAAPFVDQYSISWPPDRLVEIFGTALAYWAVLVALAFLISLFCKLNVKRFHYHRVLFALVLAALGAKALAALTPTIAFNLRYPPLAAWILPVGFSVIAFLLFYNLQRWCFRRWLPRRRAAVAVAAGAVTFGLIELAAGWRAGPGDRDRMSDLGFPLRNSTVRQTSDDLIFDLALSIAETDERRIHTLEALEAERDE